LRIRTQCRACGLPFRAEIAAATPSLPCPNCHCARDVAAAGWSDGTSASPGTVDLCPLCGSRHLYRQRDVNRALGCGLVLVGAALVPWTFGLSLLVFGLVDLWLYRRLPLAVVCYVCDTVYRDARPLPRQADFELLKHDVLKYGKTWEDASGRHGASQDAGDGHDREKAV
jgi:hypothetical protein